MEDDPLRQIMSRVNATFINMLQAITRGQEPTAHWVHTKRRLYASRCGHGRGQLQDIATGEIRAVVEVKRGSRRL